MVDIPVYAPNFWWRAPQIVIAGLVQTDPDVEDQKQRWPDRDQQRWPLVAVAVQRVADAIASGTWAKSEDWGFVSIVDPGLTSTEFKIVRAWFSASEPVRVDPWFSPLGNGRHRLWATRNEFEETLVPILGDSVGYANHEDVVSWGSNWPSRFNADLTELKQLAWFDESDPINSRFIDSLSTAASGRFPNRS